MRIKNIKHFLSGLLCFTAAALTGCSDYLDLKPLNDVVLENYWTKKSDVTSVLMGCYESLYSSDCITRMGLWGEARSDNMIIGVSSSRDLEQLIKEDLLPSNPFCNWASFYQTINRCNIVIHYAPEVQELDPNYSLSEMKANIAEATFIRSLCYFHLIRAFRDVPFTREPSIDDTQDYQLPATSFDTVLANLIEDLEAVKDDAQLYFRKPNPDKQKEAAERDNTARVTRPAVYALLADLYLWKGDWQKCIACCDYVIDFKKKEYESLKRRLQNDVYLFNDIPLIMEKTENTSGNAYNEIFGEGNSFESLFELTYSETFNTDNRNSYVGDYYANNSSNSLSNGRLAPFDEFYGDLPNKNRPLQYQRLPCLRVHLPGRYHAVLHCQVCCHPGHHRQLEDRLASRVFVAFQQLCPLDCLSSDRCHADEGRGPYRAGQREFRGCLRADQCREQACRQLLDTRYGRGSEVQRLQGVEGGHGETRHG